MLTEGSKPYNPKLKPKTLKPKTKNPKTRNPTILCLLGQEVRFDGWHNRDTFLMLRNHV